MELMATKFFVSNVTLKMAKVGMQRTVSAWNHHFIPGSVQLKHNFFWQKLYVYYRFILFPSHPLLLLFSTVTGKSKVSNLALNCSGGKIWLISNENINKERKHTPPLRGQSLKGKQEIIQR